MKFAASILAAIGSAVKLHQPADEGQGELLNWGFELVDTNDDGVIDIVEAENLLGFVEETFGVDLADDEAEAIYWEVAGEDGLVQPEEFVGAIMEEFNPTLDDIIGVMFDGVDGDDNGTIDIDEFVAALEFYEEVESDISDGEWDDLVEGFFEVAGDDEVVDYGEFREVVVDELSDGSGSDSGSDSD